MKPITILALLLTALGCAFAQDDSDTKIPASAQQLLSKFEAESSKLRADAEKAVKQKAADLVSALTKTQEAETKKGNLDGALALKAKIAELQKIAAAPTNSTGPAVTPKEVSLTTLNPIQQDTQEFWVVKDEKSNDHKDKVLFIDGKQCYQLIFAHAPSVVGYRIPAGAKRFKAVATSFSAQNMKFVVAVDGKEVFKSNVLSSYPSSQIPIDVELPAGAQKIALTVDPNGSNNAAHSCWANPVFTAE